MVTTYRLDANELTVDLIDSIRLIFKDKDIEINVSEIIDETEYLLSSPANKETLLESIQQLEQGKGVTTTIEELQTRFSS